MKELNLKEIKLYLQILQIIVGVILFFSISMYGLNFEIKDSNTKQIYVKLWVGGYFDHKE